MSDNEEYDLLDYARAGERAPFEQLFSRPEGVKEFLAIKDEFTEATPLHMAAANGHSELLAYFISQIKDPEVRKEAVNATNDSGNTPMHWAALTGSLDSVKMLHEAGADPLKKNKTGIDPCYQADCAGQEEVANYLYSIADVDHEQGDGQQGDGEGDDGQAS